MKPLHQSPQYKKRLRESLVAHATHFEKMAFNFDATDRFYHCLKHAFLNQKHRWDFMLGVAQSDGDQQWFNWERITAKEHVLLSDIRETVESHLDQLKSGINPKHYVGLCWAAMPCGITFSEEHLADYMTKGGIFDV